MKKKLVDLTIGELINICNHYKDCNNCQFHEIICFDNGGGIAKALCVCEENGNMIVKTLDKKKRVMNKKKTIKDRLESINEG